MDHLGGGQTPIDGRLRLAAFLLVLVFSVFVVRLFQLQIVEGAELRARAKSNSVRTVRLEPPRGEILDREGRVLAGTRAARELQIIPSDLRDPSRTYAALGQLLDRDPAEIAKRVGDPHGAMRFRPVLVADDLDYEHLARVMTHSFALPGVRTYVRPRRHYLEGFHAAHLLGTIGEIRADQLDQEAFAGYRQGDVVGQTGLEARFEKHLHGRAGGRNVMVDAAGREVEVLDEVPPVPGGRLVLAIDIDLQREAEAAFQDVPPGEPPRMGAAVAMDVNNGDVLAMASLPSYDPNDFAGGIDTATWDALTSDPWRPLRSRAIQNHYPPGSTFKAFVAAALLQEGVIDRHTRLFCPGYFRFGGRTYRCWKRSGHGWMDVIHAIQHSCDVFFYTFGSRLGIDALARNVRSFGLGAPTGIVLPGEVPGLVPDSAWKRKRFGEPWYPGETVSAAIGQGYNLVTPLQLAVGYAAIANGGKVLRPRLVLRLEDQNGVVERNIPVKVMRHTTVKPEYLAIVRQGLAAVVNEPGGTGSRARIAGLRVAGKTGTVQVVGLGRTEGLAESDIPIRFRDHAWFVAYAPAENPEIAVSVFVEHGLHGATAAAPIARRIIERWYEKHHGGKTPQMVAEEGS